MYWSFTRVSSCSDFTGKLLVLWILGDHLWKVKLFTRGCQVGLCFSGICNSVVGFVAFCTRLGSIRGCRFAASVPRSRFCLVPQRSLKTAAGETTVSATNL